MIIKKPTALDGCYEVELKRSGDDRGYFSSLTKKDFKDLGFKRFCQFSESKSSKGVLRGMHFQEEPYAQAKLVSVTSGKALDVVVDCRKNSKTFGKYVAVELDANKRNMLYVPRGFAHGFLSLEDNTVFQYFVDNDYAPKKEGGIAFDDKIVNIPWDEYMKKYNIDSVVLSDKDKNRNGIDKMPVDFSLKKNKYLVTGSSNMLGHDVVNELEERGENKILATTLDDFDITDSKTVMDTVKWYNPDVIIKDATINGII